MARVTRMTPADCRERAAAAGAHLRAARDALERARSAGARNAEAQVAASNAVLSAIAAADAVCGAALGERSSDQDHKHAAAMLTRSSTDGPALAKKFGAAVARKSQLQYGGFCTADVAAKVIEQAATLVAAAERAVR